MMTGRGARARLHDVERPGEVGQMPLRLAQRAGDPGQRKGEHAPPEGAHEVVVEAIAALVVPAVRVREDLVERALVDEREDARARASDDAADALPPLRVLGFAGLLAERPRRLAHVGHPEAVVEQEVVGGLALRGVQQTYLVETLPEPLAHAPLEVVAGLHAGRPLLPGAHGQGALEASRRGRSAARRAGRVPRRPPARQPVSYTHLTLP